LEHPVYLTFNTSSRLNLVRRVERGLNLSVALFHLKAWHWVKTGKLG